MSDEKYKDLDDIEEIEGDYAEIDEQFDEVEYDEIDEPIDEPYDDDLDNDDFIESDYIEPDEIEEYIEEEFDDDFYEPEPRSKKSFKKQKVLGLLHSGVSKFDKASDAIMKTGGKTIKRKKTKGFDANSLTGIKGDTSGILRVSGKNIGIVSSTNKPRVTLSALPLVKPWKGNKSVHSPVQPTKTNLNSLNSVLMNPNKKVVNKKPLTKTFVKPLSVKSTGINVDLVGVTNTPINLSNCLPKSPRTKKSTFKQTPINLSGFENLTNKILNQKKRSKK